MLQSCQVEFTILVKGEKLGNILVISFNTDKYYYAVRSGDADRSGYENLFLL